MMKVIKKCNNCGKNMATTQTIVDRGRGKYCSRKCMHTCPAYLKTMRSKNLSKSNGMWKGDKVGINPTHVWVRRRKLKPDRCETCSKQTTYLDMANISGEYKRDISDFQYICRSCHMKIDGRMNNLRQYANSQ